MSNKGGVVLETTQVASKHIEYRWGGVEPPQLRRNTLSMGVVLKPPQLCRNTSNMGGVVLNHPRRAENVETHWIRVEWC